MPPVSWLHEDKTSRNFQNYLSWFQYFPSVIYTVGKVVCKKNEYLVIFFKFYRDGVGFGEEFFLSNLILERNLKLYFSKVFF